MNLLRLAIGSVLLAASGWIAAAPVSANSPSDKQAGQTVQITLSEDSTAGFQGAATINVFYDPAKLTYLSGAPGTLFDPATSISFGLGLADVILPGDPFGLNTTTDRNLILATLIGDPLADGLSGSLLVLDFTINAGIDAGTETFIDFSCHDFGVGTCTPGNPPSQDYVFASTQAKVTVAGASTPMPLPGTLPLIGLGMMALAWARRQRN